MDPAAGPGRPPVSVCRVFRSGASPHDPGGLDGARAAVGDGGFVWVGLHEPDHTDMAHLVAAFELPHLAVDDAIKAHQRPKLEVYGEVLFAVLKPVRYGGGNGSSDVVDVGELAVFLGPGFVVTVSHHDPHAVDAALADLDAAAPALLDAGPVAVLYRLADRIVDGYEEVAAAMTADIDDIETLVFGGDSTDHAERIYSLKREVIEFRRAVAPLAVPMQRLSQERLPGSAASLAPFFRDVHDHVLRAADAIEGFDRMLSDVLTADLSQVSIRQNQTAMRQNEDMRKISAWAAIGLVPTAIAGIYGMNFEHMPELHWRLGYPMAVAGMAAICGLLYRLFRRNGWL